MAKKTLPLGFTLAASGPYSGKVAFSNGVQIDAGRLLFVSGQLAYDDARNLVGVGDMKAQTRQVLANIRKVLDWAGAKPSDIVKVTVFVKDISRFREIHDARLEFFHPEHLPASTMVEVSQFVHPDALIEIEAIAALPAAPRRAKAKARKSPRRRASSR